MKATIQTHYGYSAEYMKADRSNNTLYPILVKSQKDGKQYWIKAEDIKEVVYNSIKLSAEKFCGLLLIKF